MKATVFFLQHFLKCIIPSPFFCQSSINLDITPNADGYSIGGGSTERTFTISGSNMTISANGNAVFTYPTQSAIIAGTNVINNFTTDQAISGTLFLNSGSSLPPISISSPGVPGQMIFSSGKLYVCTASNAWQVVSMVGF